MEDRYLKRAKKIIQAISYITIATVSEDGQPWNTPVLSAFDENYNFFWVSYQNAQHSKNIKNNSKIFFVIYDSTASLGTGEGVYIQARASELTDREDIDFALGVLAKRLGHAPDISENFTAEMPRRIYKATPDKIWVNDDGEINGHYIDVRIEVEFP